VFCGHCFFERRDFLSDTAMTQRPSNISATEDAAKIRVAALEAAKAVPGASLGEGELSTVIDQAQASPLGSDERVTKAAGLATTIAKAQSERPLNYLSATPQQVERERAVLGLPSLSATHTQGRFSAAEPDGEGRSSGARYDGMNGAGLTQIQMQTRDYAIKQGVFWAADNKDILKLGPAAIDVLARTGLRKDVYTGLTKEAGLSAKGAIGIADMLDKDGKDANAAGNELKKSLLAINDPKYTAAVAKLGELQLKPGATEQEKATAVENVKKAGAEALRRNPKAATTVQKTNEILEHAATRHGAQATSTATQAADTQTDVDANKRGLAALNGTASPAPSAKLETKLVKREPGAGGPKR
jgi:hypothetical protein